MGDLQGRVIRVLLGRAAEDLRQPPDAFLMRHVRKMAVAEVICQAVWAGIHRPVRRLARHPKIPPPRHKGHSKEDHADGYCEQYYNLVVTLKIPFLLKF